MKAFWPLCLLLTACGSTTTHQVVTGTAGAPRSGSVQILMGEEAPPEGLHEVAILQAIGHGTHADLEHVVAGLKENALALGCTVIAKVKVDQGAATASGTGVCLRP